MALLPLLVNAQLWDDFSDLELSADPIWLGTLSTFTVNADSVLQLDDINAGSSYISTGFTTYSLDDVEWQFWVKHAFSGSANNFGRVYLASDQEDVSGSLNGYFIQFGESGSDDAIELFKQEGTTYTSVARGTDGLVSGSFEMRMRVRRDGSGNWEIGIDQSGGTDFVTEATGTDNSFGSTTHFGLLCTYTGSNATNFYYDDLYLGAYILDVSPPEIVSIMVMSSTELNVLFSEPVSQATAEVTTHYSVDGGIGDPTTAILNGSDQAMVDLTFGNAFTNGTSYQLAVSGVEDMVANQMVATTEPFMYVVTEAATFRDVVINEFLPDPIPVVLLPEGEFVEVYNTSQNYIDLENWTLGDASSQGTVGAHIIGPGEYAILTSTSNTDLFDLYENVVAVTSFPSYNNLGDDIVLRDDMDVVIDRLSYTSDWYQDETKADGGYSLEQINPLLRCSSSKNWIASNAAQGGTPNALNSVFDDTPDTVGPSLIGVRINGAQQLDLMMDEPLDSTLVNASNVLFDPQLAVALASSIGPAHQDISVLLSAPIDTGTYYKVTVTGLSDCEGNAVETDTSELFILPFTADSGDLVINEVLFDPFTGGYDYVELVNVSERVVNLNGWMLANYDVDDGISNHKTMINGNYAVAAGGYVLLTEDTTDVMMSYIQHGVGNLIEADLPTYPNDSGTVYLLNMDSLVAERFGYIEDMHFSLLSSVDGVSLERLDATRDVNDAGNWHSAAETVGFGTPGLENSQYYPTSTAEGEVNTDPAIFSPDNDAYNDVLNINYSFTSPGFVGTIRIYDANGRTVRELATNELLATTGTFTWDGTSDNGEKARIGMYIILFEAFNDAGKTNTYKLSTVLGGRL